MVAQKRRAEVLDRVHLRRVHHRLAVRLGHADIEGRNHLRADVIFPGDIQPRKQLDVVNRKARNLSYMK